VIVAAEVVRPPSVAHVLRRSVRDFYEESWRLVLLNTALSAYVLAVLAVATYVPVALVLLVGAGAFFAALVSAAVIVVETGSLTFLETAESLRRCWLRGLVLGAGVAAAAVATVVALGFYAGTGTLGRPLAVLVVYLGAVFALHQLMLWPLAVREPERPLREVAADAAIALVRRPVGAAGLAVGLLLVNLLGVLAAVLPFLTMTVAYSALAAARVVLPPTPPEEA
jgi:hypothetical protein